MICKLEKGIEERRYEGRSVGIWERISLTDADSDGADLTLVVSAVPNRPFEINWEASVVACECGSRPLLLL